MLERSELAAITLTGASNPAIAAIAGGDRWTIEIQTPNGAIIDLTRSMPSSLQAVMQLR